MIYLIKLIMGKVKELNIKDQTYYFFDNMIDIKIFQSDLLTSLSFQVVFLNDQKSQDKSLNILRIKRVLR